MTKEGEKKMTIRSKNNTVQLNIAIDAEFNSENCVSLQVLIDHRGETLFRGILLNKIFSKENILTALQEHFAPELCSGSSENEKLDIRTVEFGDDKNVLLDLLVEILHLNFPIVDFFDCIFDCNLIFFYSFKDLEYSFGFSNLEGMLKQEVRKKNKPWICQTRSIIGFFNFNELKPDYKIKFRLVDMKGYTNGSLLQLAKSVGVEMAEKSLMDAYKESMDRALEEEPVSFVKYSMGDVDATMDIFYSKLRLTNKILVKNLKLPPFLMYTESTIKVSNGSLVSDIFVKKMTHTLIGKPTDYHDYRKYRKKIMTFQLAQAKLSILNQTKRGYKTNLSIYNRLFSLDSLEEMVAFIEEEKLEKHDILTGEAYLFNAYSYGSVKWFLSQNEMSTAGFNALVSGGRCVHENPSQWVYENTMDIDISGCYGNSLSAFSYPIGLCTVFAYGMSEPKISLGEFLKRNEHELLPNLYKIIVSGKLSFKQDLIFSKLLKDGSLKATVENYKKEFSEGFDDAPHISSTFILLQNEIENGVITADVLECIRAVASNQELKEFMKLEVVTASYWKKSDYIENYEEWAHKVIESKGIFNHSEKFNALLDNRCKYWTCYPISDFIDPLKTERKKYQRMVKETSDEKLKSEYGAVQESIKLLINTLYGTLASIYFKSSNAIVADNITARARVEVWKVSKALLTLQSITDGGAFLPQEVLFFREIEKSGFFRRPGFNILATRKSLLKHRCVKTGPLGGLDWKEIFERYKGEPIEQIYDVLALEHVKQFWMHYNLGFKFDLEFKYTNTSNKSVLYSKAHYLFSRINPVTGENDVLTAKIRGLTKDHNFSKRPLYNFLLNILNGVDEMPENSSYYQKTAIKISSYLRCKRSKKKNAEFEGKRPGDFVMIERKQKYYNTFLETADVKTYKKRYRRTSFDYGFEKKCFGSISKLKDLMEDDKF